MVNEKEKRIIALLSRTQDPYVLDAVNTALSDPSSFVGAELRRILSHQPGEAFLEYLLPTFPFWPADEQQQAIQSSKGAIHHILRSLTREAMTAEQWRVIGKRCTKTRTRELLTTLNPSDSVLVALAQTNDYLGRNHAQSIAEEILVRTPELSPERFAYVASNENSVRLADIIRDGMTPDGVAMYITPKTVTAAWAVLGTSAATDDRVIRWSRWLYEARKNSWRWSSFDQWADVDRLLLDPELMTGFLLGKVATERQLACSETDIFRKIYAVVTKALNESQHYWAEMIDLRVNPSLRAQDLIRLATLHVWNHDLLSNSETDRIEVMRMWHPAYPPEEVLSHITSQRYSNKEVALAVALALNHYTPQNLSCGGSWGKIRDSILAREEILGTELNFVLSDIDYIREFDLDVDIILRKARYGLTATPPKGESQTGAPKQNLRGVVRLRELDDIIALHALIGWRSRNGMSGREDYSLPLLFDPFLALSTYEQQAFHTLLPEWDGDIISLCATARSLS